MEYYLFENIDSIAQYFKLIKRIIMDKFDFLSKTQICNLHYKHINDGRKN